MYERFVEAIPSVRGAYERNEPASVLRQAMALADEANRYIDEKKPWVIAKQEGADAELQSVCTQGLNLFRVLAAMLKPSSARWCRGGATSASRCSAAASIPTRRFSPASTRSRSNQ